MVRNPKLSIEMLMKACNEDLERAYQLTLKRIDEYDLGFKDEPEYRRRLSHWNNLILDEMIRRRKVIHS